MAFAPEVTSLFWTKATGVLANILRQMSPIYFKFEIKTANQHCSFRLLHQKQQQQPP